MLLPVDPKGQTVAWGLTEEIDDKNGRIGWKEYEESGEVIRVARRNYADVTTDPIRCLMDSMDEEKSNIRLWAHYSIPDLPVWHKGRVCLIGDAAHAFPPNGLGISMALEDSGILARLLSSDQAVKQGFDKLFSHFEIARRKRVESVKKSARSSGAIKSKTGPWGWWLKQWIFYAFFAWNGWLLRPPSLKSIYDVEEEDIEIE